MIEWQKEWNDSGKWRKVYEVCKGIGMDRLPLSFKGGQPTICTARVQM